MLDDLNQFLDKEYFQHPCFMDGYDDEEDDIPDEILEEDDDDDRYE